MTSCSNQAVFNESFGAGEDAKSLDHGPEPRAYWIANDRPVNGLGKRLRQIGHYVGMRLNVDTWCNKETSMMLEEKALDRRELQ